MSVVLGPALEVIVPPKLSIIAESGPCTGEVFQPDVFYVTVGRLDQKKTAKTAVVHFKDQSISERHAEICWNGQHWILTDTGSSYHTWHKGRKLQPHIDVVHLKNGDRVQFGSETVCTVKLEPQDLTQVTLRDFLNAQCEVVAQKIEDRARLEAKILADKASTATLDLKEALKQLSLHNHQVVQ